MSLNITGKAWVYNFEDKGNYAKASLSVGKKKQDGTWENMWFNCKFVGKNKPDSIAKGEKIEITSAILESFKGEKGTYITVVIFDFAYDGEPKTDNTESCPVCGMSVDECNCELPF